MTSYAEQMAAEYASEATSAVLQVPMTPKSAHLTAPTSPYANHDLSKSCSSALPSPSLATKLESKSKDIFSWTDTELASKYQFSELFTSSVHEYTDSTFSRRGWLWHVGISMEM